MASEPPTRTTPSPDSPIQSGRHGSPTPNALRQRLLSKTNSSGDQHVPLNRRRSSIFSEGMSETRKSLRSSTDNLLYPRSGSGADANENHESSHWHSLPLGLALLPAVGGMVFKDGSAVITDITLLGLAAIFMNWALRMPWDWYNSAQATVDISSTPPSVFTPIEEEDENSPDAISKPMPEEQTSSTEPFPSSTLDPSVTAAQRELRIYEMIALLSCFVLPGMAAWLLHGIRSQLSRPSEGLVSNYNLTVFLLVAEIRPVSHLIKMVQKRTLYLQRKANVEVLHEQNNTSDTKILDLSSRIEELEAHVANRVIATEEKPAESTEVVAAKVSAQASSEIKKSIQPELEALNRAMRRYEKRTTLSAIQIEARLQDLEGRLKDVVVLAAAAQRNADQKSKRYTVVLTNWVSAAVVVPVQYMTYLLTSPLRMANSMGTYAHSRVFGKNKSLAPKDNRSTRRAGTVRVRGEHDKRLK